MDSDAAPSTEEEGFSFRNVRPTVLARYLMFFSLVLSLLGSLHLYVGSRLIGGSGLAQPWRSAGWGVIAALFFSIPLGFFARRRLQGNGAKIFFWTSYLWLGSFGLFLSATVLTDLMRGIASVFWLGNGAAQPASWGQAQALAIVFISIPAAIYGVFSARGPATVERVQFPIARLGAAFNGLRIVQITDVHIGDTLGQAFMQRIVNQVNALKPDIVAITGDLIDGSVNDLRQAVSPLRELVAGDGVYFVTGNHEYYSGAASWESELRNMGIRVLHNEHQVIQRGAEQFVMAGVTDLQGGQFNERDACRPDLALAGAPESAPKVLLAHQPRAAALAKGLGVDLQLSGHTHGGQIFPFMFFVRLQQPVISGLKQLFGTWVYTSRGTGYWGPPLRVGPSPEITEITLTQPTPAAA